MDFGVITFVSTHAAIRTQNYLERHLKVSMMPTLREISQGCGISLRFALDMAENVQQRMVKFDLDPQLYSIYRIHVENGKYITERLGPEEPRP
ncbi:MAG TPA: hypothetical protein DIT32_08470 [Peptococcaceae bacterium]|nr:hypothetical protein [Peptococcaceae bacterium]